jgi:hypothetical protein
VPAAGSHPSMAPAGAVDGAAHVERARTLRAGRYKGGVRLMMRKLARVLNERFSDGLLCPAERLAPGSRCSSPRTLARIHAYGELGRQILPPWRRAPGPHLSHTPAAGRKGSDRSAIAHRP